jgi:alpha-N-arabinofuranosidase
MIKGSEVIKEWEPVQGGVWKVILPNSFFGDFNPYNDIIGGEWYNKTKAGLHRHSGVVYLNGKWLD